MENTKENPRMRVGPVIELRQDDVVAVPLERYEQLIEAETRLDILIEQRCNEIAKDFNTYIPSDDYILGERVMSAHWLAKQERPEEAKDE